MQFSSVHRRKANPIKIYKNTTPDSAGKIHLSRNKVAFRSANSSKFARDSKNQAKKIIVSPLLSSSNLEEREPVKLNHKLKNVKLFHKLFQEQLNETVLNNADDEFNHTSRPPARQRTPPRALNLEFEDPNNHMPTIKSCKNTLNLTTRFNDFNSFALKKSLRKRANRSNAAKSSLSHREKLLQANGSTPNSSRLNQSIFDLGRALENSRDLRFILKNITEQPKSVSRIRILQA